MKTIDAQNKKLGRVASEVAALLIGKNSPKYEAHSFPKEIIQVINVSKLKIEEKKKNQKMYKKHTGYPGSLTYTPMKKIIENKGYEEIFKKAVRGMLPDNKLRSKIIKNLKITA